MGTFGDPHYWEPKLSLFKGIMMCSDSLIVIFHFSLNPSTPCYIQDDTPGEQWAIKHGTDLSTCHLLCHWQVLPYALGMSLHKFVLRHVRAKLIESTGEYENVSSLVYRSTVTSCTFPLDFLVASLGEGGQAVKRKKGTPAKVLCFLEECKDPPVLHWW